MIKFLPALPHAATIPLAILLLAACGHKNGNQAIGSADGPPPLRYSPPTAERSPKES